jgi:Tol biopolymer transport system component
MKLRILLAGLICGAALLAADTGAELFQKAVTQEQAAGNLPEAIRLYQQVAKDYASNRPLAAKALIQAARCYEKLGQDKATKIYEQVARDFSDQAEQANAARARLAALRQPAPPITMTARRIEPVIAGAELATDGRRVIYRDESADALMISDLAGRNKRLVYKWTRDNPLRSFSPSRDLSMVAVTSSPGAFGARKLAVVNTDGTNYREIGQANLLVTNVGRAPLTWSWDNRYVLLRDPQPDDSTVVIRVSVADGQRREILRSEKTPISQASLSPDGRFIAYSEGSPGATKVFVAPCEGGEPRLVSEDANFLDWTRDGRYLAVNRGRPDSRALYLLPVKDGQAAGEPVFIRNGAIQAGGITAGGALFYVSVPPLAPATFVLGTLGPDGHVIAWKPLSLASRVNSNPFPVWSPDSRRIAYTTENPDAGGLNATVRIRDIVSEEDREIYRSSAGLPVCVWATQHANLFCGEVAGPTTEILSLSVDGSRVERIGSIPEFAALHGVSRDDATLYMSTLSPKVGVVRFNIATREESAVEKGVAHSPDGSWVYMLAADQRDVQIRPGSGSDWRHLVSVRYDVNSPTYPFAFTAGGNWFFYPDKDSAGNDSLFRVSTAGGEPERLGDFPSHARSGYLKVSPDEGKILFGAQPNPQPETWLLENFEPKQAH